MITAIPGETLKIEGFQLRFLYQLGIRVGLAGAGEDIKIN